MFPQPPAPDEAALSAIESVLLVAADPVAVTPLAAAVGRTPAEISRLLDLLDARLVGGIRLQREGDSVQLVTAPENVDAVRRFLGTVRPAPLSRAALETLTVIAYHQPATRAEVEAIRGVNSDRAVQTLLARDLIEDRGQRAVIGRPTEYGTSFAFLEYFGLKSLDDLPPLPAAGDADFEDDASTPRFGLRRPSD